jgi:uncharacterized protein YceK
MRLYLIIMLALISLLAGCASTVIVTNQDTGVSGSGTATGATFGSMGKISIAIDGEIYSGTWVAMRDSGL